MPQGCPLDTDGDGNCYRHPNGCPPINAVRFYPTTTEITGEQFVGLLENMMRRSDGAVTEQTTIGELIARLRPPAIGGWGKL